MLKPKNAPLGEVDLRSDFMSDNELSTHAQMMLLLALTTEWIPQTDESQWDYDFYEDHIDEVSHALAMNVFERNAAELQLRRCGYMTRSMDDDSITLCKDGLLQDEELLADEEDLG
ncbi:MAG: hypothetical protein EOO16_00320 [Chitinophagaceae bacterium]|nr:MAG: hypothetical protein EOO16_00320 [Chitinophagaceae bacterium]